MRAAIAEAPQQPLTVVDDVELESPHEGEVAVRIEHCGVCGSDLHYVDGTLPSDFPLLLGHEASGIVTDVGAGVTGLREGERVVLTFRPPCKRCYWCVRGEEALCSEGAKLLSGRYADGGTRLSWRDQPVVRGVVLAAFAEATVVPAAAAIPLPDDVPMDVAALMGCAVQTGLGAALNTAPVTPGDTVMVVGLGGVGTSIVQGAVIAGASTVIGVDPAPERRALAAQLGASHVLDPAEADSDKYAKEMTGGIGVDVAFDAVGNTAIVEQLLKATRNGGTTVMVGVPGPKDSVSVRALVHNAYEKKLLGCYLGSSRPHFDIPRALDLWRTGRLDVSSMLTAHVDLADINDAIAGTKAGHGMRWMVRG